jgi:parvulin-like peptidyl-prolyl isomerase
MSLSLYRYGALLALVLTAGCRKSEGPVLAEVGSTQVTTADVQVRLEQMPQAYQQYGASAEGRRQFLKLIVREKTLLEQAKKEGIAREPSYKAAVKRYKDEADARLKEYQDNLLVESLIRKLQTKELAITDTDVEQYYKEHRAEYDKPLEVQASHILVSTAEDAENALRRLKAGEPFEQVARQMSKDPATGARGGRLDPFRRGMLVPEFEEAVFRMRNGEVSAPVKTHFGFHIIRKLAQRELPPQSFDAVKEEIRARLQKQKFEQWVSAKQATLGVKINDQAISAMPAPAASPQEP